MIEQYRTIAGFATSELKEKKSRFICSVSPIECEDDATTFINKLKSEYWNATHNVYCYTIGLPGDTIAQRYSDDGEPTGTAGVPMLEVVKKLDLHNIVIVVTRYFGGILLGIPGLVRAYSKSAASGIMSAGIIIKTLCHQVNITCSYSLADKLRRIIETSDKALIDDIIYHENVTIKALIPANNLEKLKRRVANKANASVDIVVTGNKYIQW